MDKIADFAQTQTNQHPASDKLKNQTVENQHDVKDTDFDDELVFESLNLEEGFVGKMILSARRWTVFQLKKPIFNWIFYGLILAGFPVYFGFAMKFSNPFYFVNIPKNSTANVLDQYIFSNNKGLALLCLTIIGVLLFLWDFVGKRSFAKIRLSVKFEEITIHPAVKKTFRLINSYLSVFLIAIVTILCFAYLVVSLSATNEWYNLVSLAGLLVYIFICILLSEHPSMINWRVLIVGCLMQYILGVFVLRTEFGIRLFDFLGNQVTVFLDFTDSGSSLVFGNSFTDHYFSFKVMAVVIYFSSVVSVLYYYGIIQYFFLKIAWIMNLLMGTSPSESIISVASVFLGTVEAPLLIKPLIPILTDSELFAIMVTACASTSGSILAAYIGFGIRADHLVTASLLSAPSSLAIAKTLFPETKRTKADWDAIKNVKVIQYNNVFEAIGYGAVDMLLPVGAIIANLIAFVSIFAFLDQACMWFFSQVALENFGLASILSYLFWPFALLLGVKPEDCQAVGKLVGYKVFLNEFVAYQKLGDIMKYRESLIRDNTYELYRNGTLAVPVDKSIIWNERSITIATYALCGFSNVGTIGIEIATLTTFAPKRSNFIVRTAARAMVAGNISAFMNACIAGLLYQDVGLR